MDDAVTDVLRGLVAEHGADVLAGDPRLVKALLGDHCPDRKREVAVLAAAAEIDVPRQLLRGDAALGTGGLATRLEDERGLATDVARWAVATWADALGVAAAPPRKRTSAPHTTPKPRPKPTPAPTPRPQDEPHRAEVPEGPGPRVPGHVVTTAESRPVTVPMGLLLLFAAWVVVVGIGGVSTGGDLLCRLEILGRPPFLWIKVVPPSPLTALISTVETCVSLGWKVLSAGLAGLLLGVTAWRYQWF